MRGRWLVLLVGLGPVGFAQGVCRSVSVEGEVTAGHGFEREIGGGLKVGLEPVASGWVVRVVPSHGARGEHDYAEVATPPYHSVNPLVVTTGFGFRAQDVIGWNPRRFHFAADAAGFAAILRAYEDVVSAKAPARGAEGELARLVSETPEGTMEILDARLVPGSADQTLAAGAVASHFGTTAHRIEQSSIGAATGAGRVEWMRFRLVFQVGAGFRAAPGVKISPIHCAAP